MMLRKSGVPDKALLIGSWDHCSHFVFWIIELANLDLASNEELIRQDQDNPKITF